MKAVLLYEYGDISKLVYEDEDLPEPGTGEVRVKLHATSINPVDWKLRTGAEKERFPLDLPEILGVDVSGEVDKAGDGVTGFPVGMRVMAKANGTYAEYTVCKADVLAPIPDALTYEQAAALPLVLLTGTQLIERAAKVEAGQTILITGALGSVGRTAVHVAKQRGARVIAGVRSAQLEAAATLGAHQVVALDDAKELAHLHDLDAVADTIGGLVGEHSLKTLRDNGVYATVVEPPKHPPARGIRVEAMMAAPDASRLYELADEVARGGLVIPIAKSFPLCEVHQATELAESGKAGGKVVLTIA
ncbi:NADP-dependent oxidoreductase [Acidipila sp. EB88]|uniref:NADP-dependent oxidoreductase n=1 Tax=Acidipila sp. EB88 TaxID=2305226 RepID=UPI000F5E1976|nr:NADP-dependent oxidoreductase [Acidipila sp. EB88]RRA49446.1 NADP-dependent oxidoreductase [Acidipila sp. EB88]